MDFSPFLTEAELAALSAEEKMELNQMAFTGNFRAFGVKGSQIATILEDIILTQDHFLEHIHLSDEQKAWLASKTLYFAPQYDRKMAGAGLRAILMSKLKKSSELMTNVTKLKLSPSSPLVTIDIDHKTNEPIIVSLDVVE